MNAKVFSKKSRYLFLIVVALAGILLEIYLLVVQGWSSFSNMQKISNIALLILFINGLIAYSIKYKKEIGKKEL